MCKNLATLWQEFVRVFNNKFYKFFFSGKKKKEGRERRKERGEDLRQLWQGLERTLTVKMRMNDGEHPRTQLNRRLNWLWKTYLLGHQIFSSTSRQLRAGIETNDWLTPRLKFYYIDRELHMLTIIQDLSFFTTVFSKPLHLLTLLLHGNLFSTVILSEFFPDDSIQNITSVFIFIYLIYFVFLLVLAIMWFNII